MANEVVIQIRDRSKTAICRETLALCAKYDVTVEDMLADGYLVLHDRMYLPKVWPYDPNGVWAAPSSSESQWYGYCELTDGEGELDLSMLNLVNKLCKTHPLNSVVPVLFSVYKNGEGLIGTGSMQILVTEPYTTTEQSFVTFKGDKGDKGDAAGFGAATATAHKLANDAEPTVTVDTSGPDTAKVFSFDFGLPKGDKGTMTVAGVDTLPEHSDATVVDESTDASAASLRFGIPMGIMPKPSAGTTVDVTPYESAKVEIRTSTYGTEYPILDFWIKVGKSAYEVAKDNGYDGTVEEWLSSLIGGDYMGMQASVAGAVASAASALSVAIYEQSMMDLVEDLKITRNALGEQTLSVRNYNS